MHIILTKRNSLLKFMNTYVVVSHHLLKNFCLMIYFDDIFKLLVEVEL